MDLHAMPVVNDACCAACGQPLGWQATDKLTGLLDRWGWDEQVERLLRYADRRPLVLLIADLDRFKLVNDTYGHLAGDEVLRAVATAIRSAVRKNDLVGRYGGHGGDEFLLLLPDADRRCGLMIARRLRARLRAATITATTLADETVTITGLTASIGGVVHDGNSKPDITDLLRQADSGLLQAKQAGRDRVAFSSVEC